MPRKKSEFRDAKQNVARIEKTISELEKEVNKKREGVEKVQLQDGQFVSNCKNCNVTCISSKCYTSWFWKPKCLRCPAKCGSDSHSAENYRWKSILLPVDNIEEIAKQLEIERNSLQEANDYVVQLAKIVEGFEKDVQEKEDSLKKEATEMNEISCCIPVCTATGDIGKRIKLEKVGFSEKGLIVRWNCLRAEILDQIEVSLPVLSLME